MHSHELTQYSLCSAFVHPACELTITISTQLIWSHIARLCMLWCIMQSHGLAAQRARNLF